MGWVECVGLGWGVLVGGGVSWCGVGGVLARLQLSKAKHQQAVLDKFDAVPEVSGRVGVGCVCVLGGGKQKSVAVCAGCWCV